MSEESKGGLWVGVLAVIVIGIVGYFIYANNRSPADNLPPLNMKREEIMRGAMVDGPGTTEPQKADPNVPQMKTPKKGL
jgi:hypothetical protein